MPTEENRKPLEEAAILSQVNLERLKAGFVVKFNKVFVKEATLVKSTLNGLPYDLNEASVAQSKKILSKLGKDISKELKLSTEELLSDIEKVAALYAAIEVQDIVDSVTGNLKLKTITAKEAFAKAKTMAMGHSGVLLEDFIETFAGSETKRVVNTIRRSFQEGRTTQQTTRDIIGTKAANFKNGILEVSRRNAKTLVSTSIQHASSAGRMALWEANSSVVEGYQWLSTLDSRTTTTCRSLDGLKFELGKGPVPPIHLNCRSTTKPVLGSEFDFLDEGATRSAEFGPVSSKKTYYSWLRDQSASFQDDVLGTTRGRLFRDGGLSAEKFSELNLDRTFKPLTLDEMRLKNPKAFERAGI
jgi:SPP1 gp7 family putative phage head morphogenesis protein